MTLERSEWRVVPSDTPRIVRRCSKCNVRKPHVPSGRFRVNGSGRKLDVWLIYKCVECDTTWNCTLLTRVSPESIPPDDYIAFMRNDDAAVWRHAFDLPMLKRNGAEVEHEVPYTVEGETPDVRASSAETIEIHLAFPYPVEVRIDHLLAARFGLSRRLMDNLAASGALRVAPVVDDPLRKRWKHPLTITLERAALVAVMPAPSP